MTLLLKNSFITDSLRTRSVIARRKNVLFDVVTDSPEDFCDAKNVKPYLIAKRGVKLRGDVFLPSLEDEETVDACVEHKFETNGKIMIFACSDLYGAGLIESRYKLSPIMLLHKLGLLGGSTVVGGNYLDRDDLELMAQEGASLVLLPSYSMGYGLGAPQASFCLKYVKCALGTADCKYNPSGDLLLESYLLRLQSALNAHDETEFSLRQAYEMCVDKGDESEFLREFSRYARIN